MALDMKSFNAIVGKNKVPKTHKDNDKDGVMNMLDCEPNNPKKQGVIHNIGASIARGVGAKRTADRIEERGVALDQARDQARQEANVERGEQRIETAVFRERERGRRARERIKGGGTFGAISKQVGVFVKEAQKQPVKRKTKKPTVIKLVQQDTKRRTNPRTIKKIKKETKPRGFNINDVGKFI